MRNTLLTIVISLFFITFISSCASDDYDFDFQRIPVDFTAGVTQTKGESIVVLKNSDARESSTLKLIQGSVEPMVPLFKTRTAWDSGNNQVRWLGDDQFGVYMRYQKENMSFLNKSNVPYKILAGDQPSSSIIAIADGLFFSGRSNNARFYAYYPYSVSNGASLQIPYTLPIDQTSAKALANADVMIASGIIANGANPEVKLLFEHKMVLLSFKINSTIAVTRNVKKVSVTGTSVTNQGTLNLETNVTVPNVNSTFTPFVTVNKSISLITPIYVDILINPCTFTANSNSAKFKVTVEMDALLGGTHSTSLETTATFVGGYRYNYNLQVLLSL